MLKFRQLSAIHASQEPAPFSVVSCTMILDPEPLTFFKYGALLLLEKICSSPDELML